MGEHEALLTEIDDRLNILESTVNYGTTSHAETSDWANHAAIADVATAIDGYGIADLKANIVAEVVDTLARKMAERYDATRVEDNVDFLCDILMDML